VDHAFGYASDQRLRDENQDAFGVFNFEQFAVAVVCDGMGGHVGGAQASALAVRTIHDSLQSSTNPNIQDALRQAVQAANTAIYEEARKNYRLMGMGTTCVISVLTHDTIYVAHVGDSRAYLLRQGEIRSLTRDHTMVNLFVDAELLSPEDAATHPEAHVLSRSLGVERTVDVELQAPMTIRPGDRLMLATDGVHRSLDESSLPNLHWDNPEQCVGEILAKVDENQGDDNATVIVVTTGVEAAGMAWTEPPDLEALREAARAAPSDNEVRPMTASSAPQPLPEMEGAEPVSVQHAAEMPLASTEDAPTESVQRVNVPHIESASTKPIATESKKKGGPPKLLKFAALAVVAVVGLSMAGAAALMLLNPVPDEQATTAPTTGDEVLEAQAPVETAPAEQVASQPPPQQPEPAEPVELVEAVEPPSLTDPVEVIEPVQVMEDAELAEVADPVEVMEPVAIAEVQPEGNAPDLTAWETPEQTEDGLPAEPLTLADFARMHQRLPESEEGEEIEEGEEPIQVAPTVQFDANDQRSCRDCALASWGRVNPVDAKLLTEFSLADDKPLTVAIFAPDVPRAPVRRPHRPSTFLQTPPRGQEQWQAVQYARNEECAGSINTIRDALDKSTDFAPLYLQAWYCFNDTHQDVLLSARPETREDFRRLAMHFDGGPPAPVEREPVEGEEPDTRPRGGVLFDATDGIEYRLHAYVDGDDKNMFADVINDLLGEVTVADHLGTDVLLEAYAAAAYARMDRPTRADTYAWARRLYTVEHAMRGSVGDLLVEYRQDLLPLIDTLIYEAKGGDAAEAARRAGVDNTSVPYIVALAWAHARGERLPSEAAAQLSHPVASVKRRPKSTSTDDMTITIWRSVRHQRPLAGTE